MEEPVICNLRHQYFPGWLTSVHHYYYHYYAPLLPLPLINLFILLLVLNGFVKSNSLQTINARADDCFPPALMNNSSCQLTASAEGSSEESGLLKVTVLMSLIFEQDALIIPQKQLCLEANQTVLSLLPPPAFPLLLLLMIQLWSFSCKVEQWDKWKEFGTSGRKMVREVLSKQADFLFSPVPLSKLIYFTSSHASCMLALFKHLNEHVYWQKYSGIWRMIRLEY